MAQHVSTCRQAHTARERAPRGPQERTIFLFTSHPPCNFGVFKRKRRRTGDVAFRKALAASTRASAASGHLEWRALKRARALTEPTKQPTDPTDAAVVNSYLTDTRPWQPTTSVEARRIAAVDTTAPDHRILPADPTDPIRWGNRRLSVGPTANIRWGHWTLSVEPPAPPAAYPGRPAADTVEPTLPVSQLKPTAFSNLPYLQ